MKKNESSISLKKIQKIELGILKYLNDICLKNDITYFLAYGSLIGAIRHGGFIPWDDDIDVMMFREDFYKLIEALNKYPFSYYKLVSYETNSRFTAPLPKIIDTRTKLIQNYDYHERVSLGVYVDIFILDGVGNTSLEAKRRYRKSIELYRKWRFSDLRVFPPHHSKIYGLLRYAKYLPNNIFGISYRLNKLKEFGEEKKVSESLYVSTFGTGSESVERNIWLKSDFLPTQRISFENLQLSIPRNYDKILRCEYGDYMKIPPVDKRKSHHTYTLGWRDNL